MVDLKCKCTTCRFNNKSNCTASDIQVGRNTSCFSYMEKRSNNAEFSDEIIQPLVRKSTDVNCSAKCSFAKNGICIANGITVGNIENNATCETFLPD